MEEVRDGDYRKDRRCSHPTQQYKPFTLLCMGVGREEVQKLIASLCSQEDLDLNASSTIFWVGPRLVTEHQGIFVCK